MNEELEMFEAIEMHLERMLSQVSEEERRKNPLLSKHEERMQRYMERLREILSEKDLETKLNPEGENARV